MTDESKAPVAKQIPRERTHHGDTIVDEYAWLAEKDDPDTIAYLKAENAYTDSVTAHLAPLREKLFGEIRARTQETDLSVPTRMGSFWYYTRTVEGQQYPIHCRVPLDDPAQTTPPATGDGAPLAGRGDPARRQRPRRRATSSSRWARSTSARTATGSPTRPTSPATSASP